MSKITVSKQQMEEVMKYKGIRGLSLNDMLYHAVSKNFCGGSKIINGMTLEQIVLSWHGYAEVEQEFVSFEVAMKARKNGKQVVYHSHVPGLLILVNPHNDMLILKLEKLGKYTLDELLEGKWTIEGEK